MKSRAYLLIAATIFGAVAIAHALRLILQVPVQVGAVEVSMGASWIGAIVAGGLSIWGFMAAGRG